MQHSDAPEAVRAWAASPPAWLREVSVQHLDDSLAAALGAGEREAISLALELHADVLLIDGFVGRQQAEARHITVTGTLTILLQACLHRRLECPDEMERLRRLWVSSFDQHSGRYAESVFQVDGAVVRRVMAGIRGMGGIDLADYG